MRWAIAGLSGGAVLGLVTVVSRDLAGGRVVAFWLENTGGLWVLTAFAVGAFAARPAMGALSGVLAMIVAVFLYDITKLGGIEGLLLRPFWVASGVGVGAVVGALAGWWAEQPEKRWLAPGIVGGGLAGEVLALAVGGFPHPMFSTHMAVAQAVLGLAGAAVAGGPRAWWKAGLAAAGVAGSIVLLETATGFLTGFIWG